MIDGVLVMMGIGVNKKGFAWFRIDFNPIFICNFIQTNQIKTRLNISV